MNVSPPERETVDSFIADFAVATCAGKSDRATSRGERVEKYNQLMRIERGTRE